MKVVTGMRRAFLDLFFPMRCILCGHEGEALCDACARSIPPLLYHDGRDTIALFAYREKRMKRIIRAFKYGNRMTLADPLGRMLYDALLPELTDRATFSGFRDAIILPVPIGKHRLRARGYNQTELLAKALANHSNGTLSVDAGVLRKVKETKRQALFKKREERMRNLKHSFALSNASHIAGKNVIILDDITTTGATFDEATATVMGAKPRAVWRVALAH